MRDVCFRPRLEISDCLGRLESELELSVSQESIILGYFFYKCLFSLYPHISHSRPRLITFLVICVFSEFWATTGFLTKQQSILSLGCL